MGRLLHDLRVPDDEVPLSLPLALGLGPFVVPALRALPDVFLQLFSFLPQFVHFVDERARSLPWPVSTATRSHGMKRGANFTVQFHERANR